MFNCISLFPWGKWLQCQRKIRSIWKRSREARCRGKDTDILVAPFRGMPLQTGNKERRCGRWHHLWLKSPASHLPIMWPGRSKECLVLKSWCRQTGFCGSPVWMPRGDQLEWTWGLDTASAFWKVWQEHGWGEPPSEHSQGNGFALQQKDCALTGYSSITSFYKGFTLSVHSVAQPP